MEEQSLLRELEGALNTSLKFAEDDTLSGNVNTRNSIRSSYFCDKVGENLSGTSDLRDYCRRQITVTQHGNKKAGEWLLDALWCKNSNVWEAKSEWVFPVFIRAALECESNVSEKDFFIDFSKLVHIRSDIKIFLGGVNQRTVSGLCEYIQKRKTQAEKFIMESRMEIESTEWFLAFWPSPEKIRNSSYHSLWDELLECPNRLGHLRRIYVFKLLDEHFVRIPRNAT